MDAVDPISVAIVEDDPETRARLVAAVQAADDLQLLKTFGAAREAIQWLQFTAPDVLLVDLGLPDQPGTTVIETCAHLHPDTQVLVITLYEDEDHVMRALESGASGYLLKDSLQGEVAECIREVACGGVPMTPMVARLALRRFRPQPQVQPAPMAATAAPAGEACPLTAREQLVLTRVAQGFSYAEIAALEGISRHTVHAHIKNIYGKLSVHSKNEAVFEAGSRGWIQPLRPV